MLAAVRCGEMQPIMLARTLATLDHMLKGRLTVNIISSDFPGQKEESAFRYLRSREVVEILKQAWTQDEINYDGKIYKFKGVITDPVWLHKKLWMRAAKPTAMHKAVLKQGQQLLLSLAKPNCNLNLHSLHGCVPSMILFSKSKFWSCILEFQLQTYSRYHFVCYFWVCHRICFV